MRKIIARLALAFTLLGGGLVYTAAPAQAHFGDWHQSDCRPDVWHYQNEWSWDYRADYWTAANGYMFVEDNPWSPRGWGMYDRYAAYGWQCGALGAQVANETDHWYCTEFGGCGHHRVTWFENGYLYYRTTGHNAYWVFATIF